MGPQRQNWTYPKRPEVLIEALEVKIARLVREIDENLDEEGQQEARLAAFREKLRQAGVSNWRHSFPDDIRAHDVGRYRATYNRMARVLEECQRHLEAMRGDQVRDPDRLYKLTHDDLEWFELDGRTPS